MVKLRDICMINPKAPALVDDLEVSFVPMPKVGEQGEFDPSEIRTYREVKKGFTNFQNGDVLFAKITPCMENGKGAVAKGLKNGYGFGSTEFHVLRPDYNKVTSEWLYYLTSWSEFRKEAEINMTGSAGQKRVPKTFLENYEVNLPDEQKQKEMADTMDQIGKLIALRKEQLVKLDQLVKSRFIELFENKDFPNVLFDDVCVFLRNGANIKQTKGARGYPITRIETLSNDVFNCDRLGYADITDLSKYENYLLESGDLLISHINSVAYLGRTVQYKGQMATPVIHGMNLLCCRVSSQFNPTYVEWFMRTPMAKDYISSITKKAVNQASMTTSDLKKMTLPKPSLELQNQFATFVEQTDKTKLAIQQSLDKLELLKKSLMQEYFG